MNWEDEEEEEMSCVDLCNLGVSEEPVSSDNLPFLLFTSLTIFLNRIKEETHEINLSVF